MYTEPKLTNEIGVYFITLIVAVDKRIAPDVIAIEPGSRLVREKSFIQSCSYVCLWSHVLLGKPKYQSALFDY